MTVEDLLAHLQRLGIEIRADGEWLRYNAPKAALTPDLRTELANHRFEILTLLRKANSDTQPAPPILKPLPRSDGITLSSVQKRLWFIDQLEPESPAYNIPVAVRISGPLDIAVLDQAFNEIIRRHEVLRTVCTTAKGLPLQNIVPFSTVSLPVIDLRNLTETEKESEALRLASEEAHSLFDLAQAPLLRFTLLHLDVDNYVLLLTTHHFVADGWSMRVLMQEITDLYAAFLRNMPSPLPEPYIQYADFAHWQQRRLQQGYLEDQLDYWKRQLDGVPSVLDLPTDQSRAADHLSSGATQYFTLSDALSEAIKAVSRQEHVTLFMTLLAAFQTLLHRYTNQDDIVVGTAVSSRNHHEIENLIGNFSNNLPLRTNFSGNPSFRELLSQVRKTALDSYTHQDLPFEKLVEELKPERKLSSTPVFQVMLVFHEDVLLDNIKLPGLTLEELPIELGTSRFGFIMSIMNSAEGLKVRLEYNTDLFRPDRMTLMLEQYQYLLEQIAAAPEKAIRSYSLVTPSSSSLLPDPRIAIHEPEHEPITNIFTAWAERTPQHPAICQGDQTWTYGQLAESSHFLARSLLLHGIKPGDVIAISGERSFGLIAGMIGIFMSRGVLLTLDPDLPSHRKQVMINEAGARYLLYVGAKRSADEWMWESLTVIRVDVDTGQAENSERRAQLETIPLPELFPEDPAYIFFTSGTTGIPKGILGWHKGISHFLNWQRQTFAVGSSDHCAQLTGISFDAVIRDIFLPLTSGATLHLPAEGDVNTED
ncbi:condensation domain-containing protein [Candidatus Poribacteria bacterium]